MGTTPVDLLIHAPMRCNMAIQGQKRRRLALQPATGNTEPGRAASRTDMAAVGVSAGRNVRLGCKTGTKNNTITFGGIGHKKRMKNPASPTTVEMTSYLADSQTFSVGVLSDSTHLHTSDRQL